MKTNKNLSRVIAIVISFILVLSSLSISTYADDEVVETGVYVAMYAVDADGTTCIPSDDDLENNSKKAVIKMGKTGIFRLEASIASIRQTTSNVKIKLPATLFAEEDGQRKSYIHDFKDSSVTSIFENETMISLIKEGEDYFLTFDLKTGSSLSHDFLVSFPNGITEVSEEKPLEATITEDDITITTAGTYMEETKVGGTLKFVADFKWENVEISTSQNNVNVKNNKVVNDIIYVISNKSLNHETSNAIFTKEYSINEKITLPQYVSYPTGDITIEGKGNGSVIKAGDTVIAEVDAMVGDAAVAGNILQFKIKKSNEEPVKAEVDDPQYKVILKNILANIEGIKKHYEEKGAELAITNETEFIASSLFGEETRSEGNVKTIINDPQDSVSVSKRSSNPANVAPGEEISYTLIVTNDSEYQINRTLQFSDVLSGYLEYVNGSAKLQGYDINGTEKTTAVPDEAFKQDNDVWTLAYQAENVSIPKDKEVKLTFTVKIKDKNEKGQELKDETRIKNAATIKVGGKEYKTNEVTDVYYTGASVRQIEKSAYLIGDKPVADGNSVRYSITLTNDSGMPMDFTAVDTLPKYIDIDSVSSEARILYYDSQNVVRSSRNIIVSKRKDASGSNVLVFETQTLSKRSYHKAVISYTAKLTGIKEDGLKAGDTITNTVYINEDKEKRSAASVQVKDRKLAFKLKKEVKNTQSTPVGDGVYSIPYELDIQNIGDDYDFETDGEKIITDVMSGGLRPEKEDKESGTISGTYITGKTTCEISGEYEKDSKGNFVIKWKIKELRYATETSLFQTGKLSYVGYVSSAADALTVSNNAYIDGEYTSTTTGLVPDPSLTKIIYSINGQRTRGNTEKECEVNSGDKLVYEIKIKNSGNLSVYKANLIDRLPRAGQVNGNTYYSLYDKESNPSGNVKIISAKFTSGRKFNITPVLNPAQNFLRWGEVEVYANDTLTIMVEVDYPSSGDFENRFLGKREEGDDNNHVTLVYGEAGIAKTLEAEVKHNFERTELTISKKVTPNTALQAGDTATFTISDFGTSAAVSNYRLVDNLSGIYGLSEVKDIRTGAYTGIEKYKLVIVYDKTSNGKNLTKTFSFNNASQYKCTSSYILKDSNLVLSSNKSARPIAIRWEFEDGGDVASMEIKVNPKVTVTIPDQNRGGVGKNVATIYYDTYEAEAEAAIRTVGGQTLRKAAMVDGKAVDNEKNPLSVGDQVTFKIEYKNTGSEPTQIGTDNPIVDYMTTKGFKAGTYPISAVLLDASGDKAAVQGILKADGEESITVSQNEIDSNKAKKVSFTYFDESGNVFQIPSNHTLRITYALIVGERFAESQKDKNTGVIDESNWNQTHNNSTIIHNEASYQVGEDKISTETGYYYQKGKNRLNMQKSVLGFGSVYPKWNGLNSAGNIPTGYGAYTTTNQTGNDTTSGDLNVWESRAYNQWENSKWRGNVKFNFIYRQVDVVRYGITVINDESSNEDLVIKNIKDLFPQNALGYDSGSFLLSGSTEKEGYSANNYDLRPVKAMLRYGYNGLHDRNGISKCLNDPIEAYSAKLTDNYLSPKYCVDLKQTIAKKWWTDKIKFDRTYECFVNGEGGNIVLKPGEGLTFSYAAPIDRSGSDPYVWTNTAVLNIAETKDKSNPFEINDDITIKSRPAEQNENAERNEGECVKISNTQFSSTVNIYPPESRLGITKTSSGKYQAAKYTDGFDNATLSIINAIDTEDEEKEANKRVRAELSTSNKKVNFADVVEWKIEVQNGGIQRSDVRITDELPDPYKVITEENGKYVMQRYNAETGKWDDIAGTIKTVTDTKKGQVQRVVADKVTLDANTTTTFRILARYDSNAFYRSKNYENSVKLEIIDASGNAGEIKTVISGNPVRDSKKRTVGITAKDYVYPSLGFETTSLKGVTNEASETAWGSDEANYVKAISTGDSAIYTLKVTNSSTSALSDFVLIDKLPQVGDTGTLETYAGRESEFSVNLADSPKVTVKKGDMDITSQAVISYKEAVADAAFTKNDWAGAGNDWTNEKQEGSNVIRINLSGVNVARGETITVTFDAKVGTDAAIGEIAWNSFGYAYKGTNTSQRLYAEPAKVGIKIYGKEISLKKKWEDITGYTRPALGGGVKIHVIGKTAEGQVGYEQVHSDIAWTESDDKTWIAKISGLPIRYEGKDLIYTAEEVNSVTGYTIRLSDEGTDEEGNPLFTFVNTQKKEISGLKTWNDGKETHDVPQLKLLKYSGGGWVKVTDKTPTWTDVAIPSGQESDGIKHIQKYVFDDLPAIDENGLPILYKVEEVSVGGYKCEEDADVIGNFTNTLLTKLKVTKVWKDGDDANRPTSINIKLLADGVIERSDTLNALTGWKKEFGKLPVYNEDGSKIVYSIEESGNEKYKATTQVTETEGLVELTVTNTLAASVNISGQKYWYDGNNQYGSRPESIELKLLQNNKELRKITVKASENWMFTVKNLPRYDTDGREYIYTITETKVTKYTKGIIEETKKTEDKNGNQTLNFKISNTYNPPGSTSIKLEFAKQLKSEADELLSVNAGDFMFDVTYKNDEGAEITETVTNDADGKVSFTREGISKAGTYTFTITERTPSSIFITKDPATITATVEVTCPEEELIVGKVIYYMNGVNLEDGKVPTFVNKRTVPKAVTVNPKLKKLLIGGDISEGAFKFTIKNEAGTPQFEKTVTAGADGTIDFGEISFEKEGNYSYEIREAAGKDKNIKYDETPIKLSVLVTAKSGTELQADLRYIRNGEILTEAQPTITNIQYAEASAELSLFKHIEGSAGPVRANLFEFELYSADDKLLNTEKNDASGKVVFSNLDALRYNYADAGKTFTYKIKEKKGTLAGYGYSTEEITVTVTVSAGADNNLYTTVEYFNKNGEKLENPSITNTYTHPVSTTAELGVYKSYVEQTGGQEISKEITEGQFSFVLTQTDGGPMPAGTDEGNPTKKTVKTSAAAGGSTLVNFGDISYTEAGTYTYTIEETAGTDPTISYDTTPITATVTVTLDEATNKYNASVSYSRNAKAQPELFTVTNTYTKPTPGAVKLVANKTYTNAATKETVAIGSDRFHLTLTAVGTAPMPAGAANGKLTLAVPAGSGMQSVDFGSISYSEAGEYRYTITEETVNDESVVIDRKTVNVTVTVAQNGTEMEATVSYDGAAAVPTFANLYKQPVTGTLQISKKFTGEGAPTTFLAGQYQFAISGDNLSGTASNDANGKVSFTLPTYTKAGTYTYEIRETAMTPEDVSISLSSEVIKATVTVSESANHVLSVSSIKYELNGEETSAPAITNTYTKPSPTEVVLEAEKSLRATSGDAPTLAAGAYSFEVKDADDKVVAEAKNAADGTITFPQIAINDAGTYTYTISEVIPDDKETGITYTTDKYKATVTAARKADTNELEITSVVYEKADGTAAGKASFVNTYTPPTGTQAGLAITKTLSGKTLSANQFSFVLKNTSAPQGVTLAADKTVKNAANGRVDFGQIGYEKEGTYEYTITEVKEGKAGYTYSDKTVNVTVVVTKEADNTLKADVSYKIDGAATSSPTLANTYTKPSPIQAELGVKKSYENADSGEAMAIAKDQFRFVLTVKNNAPMPEAAKGADTMTVTTNAAAGGKTAVLFGSISYTEAGTYTYTIAEAAGTDPTISYDTTPITATVTVTLDEATNKYNASVSYSRNAKAQPELFTVTNTYTKPTPGAVKLVANKTYTNAATKETVAIGSDQFHLTLTAVGGAPMPKGAANGKLTLAVPAGSGMQSVDFGSIAYEEEGTYRYTIKEEAVNDESVVIDSKTVNVTVTVVQNGTEMKATVSYDGAATVPTFANLYKQPVSGKLEISKKFTGEGAPTTFLAGQYQFAISGDNLNGTASNDANGKVSFTLPTYTKAGTYTYEIRETAMTPEDVSISLSSEVIKATVIVSESADHVLSISSIKYELNGTETSAPAITNTYTKPSPTEVVLEAEKSLRATSGDAPALAAGTYSFEVKDADGKVVATAKNAEDGTITFSQITISDAGTYTYTISEVIPDDKETGITYTTDKYKATVTAARKASENTLEIKSVIYEKADGTTVDKPAFVNTYTPPTGTQAEIEVSKELTGKVLTANMFSFTLTNTKVPAGETLAQPVTVKNDANGKVKFTLNYNKDVDADYEYEIREVNDGKAGYEYSDKVIKVTVHVGKNADNKLVTTVTYSMDGTETQDPTFVNTYTKPNPTEAQLGVKKKYVNADGGAAMAIAKDQFRFVLTAQNGAPMPEAAKGADTMTVTTNAAAGGKTAVLFGSISYTEAGTYTYTIEEEKGSNASISYDTTPITATVVIGVDETTNTYTQTITYSRGLETKDDGLLTVTNTYKLPSATSIAPEVTKKFINADGSAKNFGSEVFTFKLYKSDANGTQGALVETKTTSTKNAAEETIRFRTLSYTEDREVTEYYLIKEEAGANPSITYDTEGILLTVEVKKVGNTLEATATYTKAGKTGDEAKVITNEYRLPQEVSVTPQVTKKFTDISGQDRNFGDDVFTFELYEAADENGTLAEGAKPIETITTTKADAAQELLKFKPISYTKDIEPGDKVTKYYVIKEAQGDNISINYDTTAIVYKVVFEKDAKDNKLKATEAYTIGGNPTNNPTITNTYKTPTPAETALTVEKYFYDKTAKADKKFGREVFTFELFKAEDENGTLAEGATAIDTKQASGADISRQTLTFLTLRHEQDMKPGDSVTEYYLIREKAPTNPSIKCENPEVIAKVVYSKAKAAGAYSDAANKIDVSVSYKMKGETAFAEGQKTVTNLYTEPEAVVPQAPIQVKKAFFDITGGDEAKTAKAIHAGEFSFTITPVGEAPMTGITQTVSTKDAASGTDTISFGNTTYTKEGVYRYLITENAGTNPSVAYDKHVIEVIVTVTKNSENKLVAATGYFVKENAEAAGTKEENPTFENLYTEPTATRFTPEVSKHLVDDASADRAFGNDIFTFNLYKAKADGTIEGAAIDTVSTSAEDKALAVKKLTFHAIELADDLAYGTAKTDFYYVIKEVKGDNPSITYDETAILVHAEVTKNADNKLEVKVTYSRGEESSSAGLEVKNIYTKPQPAKYVIEFTKKYFDITSGTETAKNFGSEIFNFSLYESNENGEQIGEPIDEISTNSRTVSSQDLAFKERVYGEDIEPGQTVTQYYLIKEKEGTNYSIGYDTKGILVKVTLTKDKKDVDHPDAKNEVIASVEYLKQTNDGFTGTWSSDKQVVRNTYTTPTPVVPESPIQVKKAFFDITGGDEAKTAKAIHAGEFSFTITPVDDAPTTGIIPTVNTKDAASGMDTISFGSTTYTKEGKYHYLITETSGKNPSVTYDKRVIEVVVTVTKTSANKLAAKTEYFVKENAEAAGTLTTNPTFENLYKAPTATNFVPEVIKHLVDVTSGAEIDRVFGKDSFTFKLYEADAAGTIKGGAIDTVSTGEEDKELALKKLAFKQIDISKDLEYGTDKTEYFYIIREEAEANPSIQDDVREILVKVTVTKTTDNKLAAKVAYIRGEEQKDTALTVTNRYTEPEPTSFTPEATKKLTGRDLKDGEFIFELLDAEGNVIDTAANAADGKIRFKTLTFKEDADAKDYVYSIREVKGNLSAVIYDKSVYTIKIHVIKNAQNKLEITDVKYVKDEKDVENITFSNTYSPYVPSVVVDITASKQFEGGILNGKDFTFKLEPVNKTEGYVRTAYNEKDGSINFGKFIYFREGVYEYILSEIVGSDRNIGYDKAQIKVTVTVRQDKYKLVADVKYDKNGQETNIFVNKNGIDPDKTSVSLYAQKILQGGELEANDFTFRLTPLNGAPGKSQQVKNTAAGDVVFDNITFTEVGTYRYEIRELQMSSKKNISYDKQKVYAAVRVYRDEYGQLLAEVSYTKNGADTNTFINKSRDDDGKPPVKPDRDSDGKFPQRPDDGTPKTGDEMMFTLWILVCLGAGAGLFAASRKNHKE